MPFGPRPANFTTAGEDFEIIQQMRGRLAVNVDSDGDDAVDISRRRHAVTPTESDLGGECAY